MAVTAVPRFHVLGSATSPTPSERTLYVDGSAGSGFRPDADLELSHWVPTRTPERWAADTSTEICLRFLEDPPTDVAAYDLAVNNHVDVDGILSLFCLVHPAEALAHRDVVVGAAEVGDLAAWAEWPSFRLAQELTGMMGGFGAPGRDPLDTYAAAFALALAVLADAHPAPDAVRAGWEVLEAQADGLDAGGPVSVSEVGARLVAYVLPAPATEAEREAALRVPPFNAVVDASVALWPHARNRRHGQAAHVVSVPVDGGWTHDLWLPGYVWAHTPDRWRPAVLGDGDSNTWPVRRDPLGGIVAALQADERRPGTWVLAEQLDPFNALPGRGFPVVVSLVGADERPTPSAHPPGVVAGRLAPAFAAA